MNHKKIILLDEKTESSLATICDVAIKYAGMHMASVIADVVNAIHYDDVNERPSGLGLHDDLLNDENLGEEEW